MSKNVDGLYELRAAPSGKPARKQGPQSYSSNEINFPYKQLAGVSTLSTSENHDTGQHRDFGPVRS